MSIRRMVSSILLALLLVVLTAAEPVFASSSALQYGMTPIYGRDIEDGTWPIEVRTNSRYYKIASCELTVKGDAMTAKITMNSTSYSYAYPGTKVEAKKDDAGKIKMDIDNENYTLTYEMDVPALDTEVPCAAYSKRRKKWYDRNLVFVTVPVIIGGQHVLEKNFVAAERDKGTQHAVAGKIRRFNILVRFFLAGTGNDKPGGRRLVLRFRKVILPDDRKHKHCRQYDEYD